MIKSRTLVFSIALAALAGSAMGQDQGGPPPGPPPGGGFQGGGPGGGMRGRPQQGMPPLGMLVRRNDVQADLGVTPEQKSQLDLLGPQRGQMRPPRGQNGGGGQGQDAPLQNRPNFDAMRKQQEEELAKILTSSQISRLKEIAVQVAGNHAILDPKIQSELGLSSDQVTKIKALMQQQREANNAIRDKVESGDLDREAARASMQKNAKALESALASILTSDQKSKLSAMGGKHFEATEPMNMGPGGFGGGPPGGGPGGPPPGGGGQGDGQGGPPPGGGDGPPPPDSF